MNDDMRAYVQSVDWHALAEKRLREDDLAAHVADDIRWPWSLFDNIRLSAPDRQRVRAARDRAHLSTQVRRCHRQPTRGGREQA